MSLDEVSMLCVDDRALQTRSEKYPFYRYAAEFWSKHVLVGDLEMIMQEEIVAFLKASIGTALKHLSMKQWFSAWNILTQNPWGDVATLTKGIKYEGILHTMALYGLIKLLISTLDKQTYYSIEERNKYDQTVLH